MRRFSVVLTAICWLASCGPKPAPLTSKPDASASRIEGSRFEGTVGQTGAASEFLTFMDKHEKQVVTLDLRLPVESFQGGEESAIAFFTVWEDCDNLAPGQRPNEAACTGFEYTVPKGPGAEHPLLKEDDAWRLRGIFKVVPAGGPLQGKMLIRLDPQIMNGPAR